MLFIRSGGQARLACIGLLFAITGCASTVMEGEPMGSASDAQIDGGSDAQVGSCEPDEVDAGSGPETSHCPMEHVVYVNFDGQELGHCPNYCDEPHNDRTWLVGYSYGGSASSWTFPPFTRGRAARDEILNMLSSDFARYPVVFEEKRPFEPPYSMVVVSDAHVLPNHGICPIDCENDAVRTCIVNKTDDDAIDRIARYVAHELGHSFGLHHVDNTADIMVWDSEGSSFTQSKLSQDTCGRLEGEVQDGPAILAKNLGLRPEANLGASCYVSGERGTCIDASTTSCAGTDHGGVCPGPTSIRCCVS